MEIFLPRGTDSSLLSARVKSRTLDQNNKPIGKAHHSPLLDSKRYEVEYFGEHIETLSANITAETLLLQVDEEWYHQKMLDKISDRWVP